MTRRDELLQILESNEFIPNRSEILSAFDSASREYDIFRQAMPLPEWRKKGFELNCFQTWDIISKTIARSEIERISIYIHIPFCQSKCGYCDCLTVATVDQHMIHAYIEALCGEIRLWGKVKNIWNLPVTVVHFGGGSPNYLSKDLFLKVIEAVRENFTLDQHTRFYLEGESILLTADNLEFFKQNGINRISIGVQTLEEPLRQFIGKKQSKAKLLRTIEQTIHSGFITAVDLIYGLPESTHTGIIDSIKEIIRCGVHGVSLYGFLITPNNREFVRNVFPNYRKDLIREYIAFLSSHRLLLDSGYTKNFFIHFARPEDENLYYRHLDRGEYLIALGATSDGVIGNCSYRHPGIEEYIEMLDQSVPPIEGGLESKHPSQEIVRTMIGLMCAGLQLPQLEIPKMEKLFVKWIEHGLLVPSSNERFILTATGSWLVDQMIEEIKSETSEII